MNNCQTTAAHHDTQGCDLAGDHCDTAINKRAIAVGLCLTGAVLAVAAGVAGWAAGWWA